MKPSHGNYRPDIDGLRGIAVLLVVAYHAFPRIARSGFVGVDVFFVISGFLISTNIFRDLAAGSFSIIDFYARRCRRIVPALVVVLVAVAAAAWFVLPGVEFTRLGRHLFAGATFSSNIVLLHDAGYFDSASALKPFLHLWSLGIEEQFYVVWPLLAMVVGRRRRSLALLVLGLFVGSFAINVSWSTSYPARDFYLLPSRFWELLLGCALALPSIAARSFGTRLAGVAAAASVALSIASVVLVASTSVFPGVWALLPTSATGFAIAAGPTAWWNRKVLANRVLVAIGLVSYPLYLWHWPLLAILRTVAPDPSIAATLVALAIAAMLAIATWRFIEG
ncbi:MAG TPA: acyltransferase, partial [Kofleriaceae bacterium]